MDNVDKNSGNGDRRPGRHSHDAHPEVDAGDGTPWSPAADPGSVEAIASAAPAQALDEVAFGGPIPNYRRGRAYVTALVEALTAELVGQPAAADRHACAADDLLGPLLYDDAEEVRDFVAGAAREAELRLARLRTGRAF